MKSQHRNTTTPQHRYSEEVQKCRTRVSLRVVRTHTVISYQFYIELHSGVDVDFDVAGARKKRVDVNEWMSG